jgi:uncharacterized membrane protein
MYPEKAKREQEKPKPASKRPRQVYSRFILALLFFLPSLFFIIPRFNYKQFVDMTLLTVMITLAVYLVYQSVIILFAPAFTIADETEEEADLWQESGNH